MHNDTKLFLEALFEPSDLICSDDSVYGTSVRKIDEVLNAPGMYVCVNALKDRRLDANVTKLQNILLEWDNIPKEAQYELAMKVPFKTLVWSGGKSYHAVIKLDRPAKDRQEYDAAVQYFYNTVPHVDKAVKNPSRFSRLPGVMRVGGSMQTLEAIGKDCPIESIDLQTYSRPTTTSNWYCLSIQPETKILLRYGADAGSRNSECFKAACDMARCGYDASDTLAQLLKVVDLSKREMQNIVKSAYKTVSRSNKCIL